MEAVIEYIIVGIIALALAFVSTPVLLDFYNEAVNATDNAEGAEADIIGVVLLLVLTMFYFFMVYVLWASVKGRVA